MSGTRCHKCRDLTAQCADCHAADLNQTGSATGQPAIGSTSWYERRIAELTESQVAACQEARRYCDLLLQERDRLRGELDARKEISHQLEIVQAERDKLQTALDVMIGGLQKKVEQAVETLSADRGYNEAHYHEVVKENSALREEIRALRAFKSDIENATQGAASENCRGEKHCACVPLLRAELARAAKMTYDKLEKGTLHLLTCSANPDAEIGCSGCSCTIGKKIKDLRTALHLAWGIIEWMGGKLDFSMSNKAPEAWFKVQQDIDKIRKLVQEPH